MGQSPERLYKDHDLFRFVLANSEYPDEVRHYEVVHLGLKDICSLFLCESFPRQETGKVVWAPSQFGPLTQLSENHIDLLTFSCQNKVIKVCPKYLLSFYQN